MSIQIEMPEACLVCGDETITRHSPVEYWCPYCGTSYDILRASRKPEPVITTFPHAPASYRRSGEVEHFDPDDPYPFLARLAEAGLEAVLVTNAGEPIGPRSAVLIKFPKPSYGMFMLTETDDVIFDANGRVNLNPPIVDAVEDL